MTTAQRDVTAAMLIRIRPRVACLAAILVIVFAQRALAASRYNSQTAAHRNSPWVFRGYSPGLVAVRRPPVHHASVVFHAGTALGSTQRIPRMSPDIGSR